MDRGESALADAGRLYRELFEHAPELVAVLDPDGTIVDVNPRVEQTVGYSREEISGRRFDFLFDEATLAEMWQVFATIVGDAAERSTEAVVRRSDGTYVSLLANSWPVVDADGAVVGVLVIAWEDSLRETSTLAHELNNLLAVVAGNAELALRSVSPEAQPRLEEIVRAARRGAQLARELLAAAR